MTAPIYLMLVFHNHQPIGQFDHVSEHSTNVSYLPLIELLERHPQIKVTIHYSGPLLDWLKQHHADVIERLRVLVTRNQVEMMSGGYYEPVMVMIPDEDKVGQIEKLTGEIKTTLNGDASGVWLAEAVWEPHLARPIAQAGMRYVILDDTYFEHIGMDQDSDLFGYFMTEEEGHAIAVFPALTILRNAIPWRHTGVLFDWLQEQADQSLPTYQPKLALMSDDGEKFGTRPGTYEHCWGDGKYMENLFTALEKNSDWLRTSTPSDYMARYPALGRVYLPVSGTPEMGEWSLPPDASHRFSEIRHELDKRGRTDITRFVRGGLWRNFLVKYDEINHLQKRMLFVSQKVHDMRRGRKRDHALDLLWASQGNDPYWHGVFGGVYLFNFRAANYAYLIAAENAAEGDDAPLSLVRTDFDRDSHEDLIVTGQPLNAIWNPAFGGSLLELDYRPAHYNLLNIMSRRKEGYHIDLINAAADGSLLTPATAQTPELESLSNHVIRAKEAGLEKMLIYDWHRRGSFLDHFIGPSATLVEFYRAQYAEQGDFVNQPYEVIDASCNGTEATVRMQRFGHVWVGETLHPIMVDKAFSLTKDNPAIQVTYTLSYEGDSPVDVRFGVETVIGLDGGQDLQYCALRINDDDERRSLAELCEIEAVTSHAADSNLRNITLYTRLSRPAFLWEFPLETITLSDAGYERAYQGTAFLHLWNVRLLPGDLWQVVITQTVEQTATRS